jgi:hypothetical protein
MAFCRKCGASLAEDVSFCIECGSPIQQGAGSGAARPPVPQIQHNSSSAGATSAPGLVTRITNILTKPKQEWGVIAEESATVAGLYSGYIVILAAIPAVAGFVQMTMTGLGIFRVGMGTALVATIVQYVLSLGGVYLAAFIIDRLAPNFQSQPNMLQALKLVAYAYTAAWVAGVFNVLPIIGFLGVLAGGIYSIYLFYLGLPVMMKTPADKILIYMIVSAVVIFVIYLVIVMVVGSITAAAYLGSRVIG